MPLLSDVIKFVAYSAVEVSTHNSVPASDNCILVNLETETKTYYGFNEKSDVMVPKIVHLGGGGTLTLRLYIIYVSFHKLCYKNQVVSIT
jgi:hypothetical protein